MILADRGFTVGVDFELVTLGIVIAESSNPPCAFTVSSMTDESCRVPTYRCSRVKSADESRQSLSQYCSILTSRTNWVCSIRSVIATMPISIKSGHAAQDMNCMKDPRRILCGREKMVEEDEMR